MPNIDIVVMIVVVLAALLLVDYLRWRTRVERRRLERLCSRNLQRAMGRP